MNRELATVAALQSRIAELEKERELRHSQFDACVGIERSNCERALVALAGARIPTPVEGYGTNTSWAISDLIRGLGELRARAEAAEKLAGDAVEALRQAERAMDEAYRCGLNASTISHLIDACHSANTVLAFPSADAMREKVEATTKFIESLRLLLQRIDSASLPEADWSLLAESIVSTQWALQRLDAANGEAS